MSQSLSDLGAVSKMWPFDAQTVDRAKARQQRKAARAENRAVRREGREMRRLNRRYYGQVGGRVANVSNATTAPVRHATGETIDQAYNAGSSLLNRAGRQADETLGRASVRAQETAVNVANTAVRSGTKLARRGALWGALGLAGGITAGEAGRRGIARLDERYGGRRNMSKSLAELGEVSKGTFSVDDDNYRKMTPKERERSRKRLRNSTLIGGAVGLPFIPAGPFVGAGVGRAWSAHNINQEMRRDKKLRKSFEGSDQVELYELGEVAKANDSEKRKRSMARRGYRPSRFQSINPRSATYVREGSGLKRVARVQAGGLGGALAGAGVGAIVGSRMRSPHAAMMAQQAAQSGGALIGSSLGFNRNIKSKDTVSFNRQSGKRAKSKANVPYVGPLNFY